MNVHSIGFRLVAWYAGLLTGIFVLLGVLFFFSLRHFMENNVRESQVRRARQIADTLLAQVQRTGEPYVAKEINTLYAPAVNNRFIRILRPDGTVFYQSGMPNDRSFNPRLVPAMPPPLRSEASKKFRLPDGHRLLVAALETPGPRGGNYLVEVGTPLDPVETMLNQLFLQLALGLPVAVGIIAGGGFLLVRRALKPVEQITRAAERITQHNLEERLPAARTGDELERLSVSLNRMIARLGDAFQNSKRFVADASHELRTPLTVLHGELEDMVSDTRLEAGVRDRAASLLEEVAHLTKIVGQLFMLSRLDAGEAQTEWTHFDLADLAKNTAEQMSLLAEDKKISIACHIPEPVPVAGDRVRLKQVIVNLLDNAIKYTPEQGAIQLSVNAVNGHALLEVADNGIGIPAEALPHVCERFFRVDQARSADSGGAGLGLSIVKSICTAHGAEVEVQSALHHGSCFRVKLPLFKN
jgi:heavy metal sensor kinase